MCGISQRASRLAYRTSRIIITPCSGLLVFYSVNTGIIPRFAHENLHPEILPPASSSPKFAEDSLFLIEQELDNVYLPPFAPCPLSPHVASADVPRPSHLFHCLPPSKFRGEDIPYRPSCSGGGTDTYLGWYRYDSLFLGD